MNTNLAQTKVTGLALARWTSFATLGLLLALLPSAQATVRTWSGASNGYWGTAANWGGVAPVSGDDLYFPASGVTRFTMTNNFTNLKARSVTFTGTGYDLRGLAGTFLTVSNGISGQQTSGANTIEIMIALGAAQTFDCLNAAASQNFTGSITNAGFTLTFSGSGNINAGSGTAGTTIVGSGDVTKSGTGTLTYAGFNNTYTGTTRVNDGTLALNCGAIDDCFRGPLIIGDSSGTAGSAVVKHLLDAEMPNNTAVTIKSDGLLNLNGYNETLGNLTIYGGGAVQTGSATLTLADNSTLAITGTSAASISGNFNIGAGTCNWVVNSPSWLDLWASVSGTANITKTGAGTIYLNAANTFTGTMTINDGALWVGNSAGLGATAGGTIMNNASVLALGVGLAVGNEALTLNNTNSSGSVRCDQGGPNSSWSGPVTLGVNASINVQTNAALTLSGVVSGAGGLTKLGPGALTLGGPGNTYTGATYVNDGTLTLNSAPYAIGGSLLVVGDGIGAAGSAVVQSLADDQIDAQVIINSDGAVKLNGHSELLSYALALNGSATFDTGAAGLATLNPGTAINVNSAGAATVSGNLNLGSGTCTVNATGYAWMYANLSGSAGLSFEGPDAAGGLVLAGSNSFSGPLTVDAGKVWVWNSWGCGATNGTVTLNNSAMMAIYNNVNVTNKALVINSTNSQALYSYGGPSSWAGNIAFKAPFGIYAETNCSLNLIGPINGTGGFTKAGPGSLWLSGTSANGYSGTTRVNEGSLLLNKASGWAICPGSLIIGDGAGGSKADVVRYTGTSTSQINTAFPIQIATSGWLDLNGHSDGVGSIVMDTSYITTGTGVLQMYGDLTASNSVGMSSISGKIQVYANRIFNVTSRDLTINATVSGSYGLTKAGAGDLWLANSNSYTGLTVVQQGKVWVENPFALGATNSGTVVSNGASLVLDVNIGVTNEALTLNGPGGGAGFAALETEAGNCTWAGPITLNATSDLDAWQATAVLHLAGPISGPGGLELFGSGIHYFEGAAANTYSGVTTVDPGTTLLLKKTVSYGAIPAGLVVNGTARLLGNNELYYASPVTTADSSGM